MGAGFTPADNVIVHGFVNINKEKMSKSRGTFITAKEFAKAADPEFLRYYFASGLTHTMTDVDLDVDTFKAKINNELVANIANFAYRTLSFLNKNYDSKLGKTRDKRLLEEIRKKAYEIRKAYEELDYRRVVNLILEISAHGNKYFQDNAPWELIKTNKTETLKVLTDCTNILKIITITLTPILPDYCDKLEEQLGLKELKWKDLEKPLTNHKIGKAKIIIKKIEQLKLDLPEKTTFVEEPFSKLDLKVAEVISVSEHYKADKLLIICVDMGGPKRQLVAGLKPFYKNVQTLIGKRIVVLSNLEHATLRGERSEGMLLAAETPDSKTVKVLEAPESEPGDQVFIKGIKPHNRTINFDDFTQVKIRVQKGKIMYKGYQLQTEKEKLKSTIKKGTVR
jgi:methionyl-tRNA synthetase